MDQGSRRVWSWVAVARPEALPGSGACVPMRRVWPPSGRPPPSSGAKFRFLCGFLVHPGPAGQC